MKAQGKFPPALLPDFGRGRGSVGLESYTDDHDDAQMKALEELAEAAYVSNQFADLQFASKRGKASFENWAIRKLWASIVMVFQYVDSVPDFNNRWAIVRDMLKLCKVDVDREMVRKVVSAIDINCLPYSLKVKEYTRPI